jgi:hypothetical protein
VIAFIAAAVTMMLGSIPQQDVFQRVQSAKSEKIAVWGSVLGGGLYFVFAFVPMFLAYSATLIDPDMVARLINTDSQMILPELVLSKAPLVAQILFFGALLSAIKSCASATLLAPSVTFTENILRPALPHLTDRKLLFWMRVVTLLHVLVTCTPCFQGQHLQDGRERLPGHPGGSLHPSWRPVLAARHQPGALLRSSAVAVWLAVHAGGGDPFIPAQLAGLSPARGHGGRLAGEAVRPPRPTCMTACATATTPPTATVSPTRASG